MSEFIEKIGELNPKALSVDGLDDAIIGFGNQFPKEAVLVYDYSKCVELLMKQNDWDYIDAVEWMEFNVVSAYHGEGTPIFVTCDKQEA